MYKQIVLLTLILVQGCTAKGPLFQYEEIGREDDPVVYIYRPYDSGSAIAYPNLYLNGNFIGTLRGGGYVKLILEEANNLVEIGRKDDKYANWGPPLYQKEIHANKGDEVFYLFEFSSSTNIFVIGTSTTPVMGESSVNLVEVPKERAMEELKKTKKSH